MLSFFFQEMLVDKRSLYVQCVQKTIAQFSLRTILQPSGNSFLSTQLGTFPPEINPGKR